jgi:hypothetical protein
MTATKDGMYYISMRMIISHVSCHGKVDLGLEIQAQMISIHDCLNKTWKICILNYL